MTNLASKIAGATRDAYSHDRYANWTAVATKLLAFGCNEEETEWVMRSKWMRYAADAIDHSYGNIPARAIIDYIKTQQGGINAVRDDMARDHNKGRST